MRFYDLWHEWQDALRGRRRESSVNEGGTTRLKSPRPLWMKGLFLCTRASKGSMLAGADGCPARRVGGISSTRLILPGNGQVGKQLNLRKQEVRK